MVKLKLKIGWTNSSSFGNSNIIFNIRFDETFCQLLGAFKTMAKIIHLSCVKLIDI